VVTAISIELAFRKKRAESSIRGRIDALDIHRPIRIGGRAYQDPRTMIEKGLFAAAWLPRSCVCLLRGDSESVRMRISFARTSARPGLRLFNEAVRLGAVRDPGDHTSAMQSDGADTNGGLDFLPRVANNFVKIMPGDRFASRRDLRTTRANSVPSRSRPDDLRSGAWRRSLPKPTALRSVVGWRIRRSDNRRLLLAEAKDLW